MPTTALDRLLADDTVRASVPAFDAHRDLIPLRLPAWDTASTETVNALTGRVATAGFALVETGTAPGQDDLLGLAGLLDLGEPFVPPLYRIPGSVQVGTAGVSQLTATPGAAADAARHPATSAIGQGWHVDGTLQQLGEVRTSLLLCVRPAATGGQSLLFNATAAFLDLADHDPAAAAALMAPSALVRMATVNGSNDSTAGPAFAVTGGQLLTRYARTDADRWFPPSGDPAAVDRALARLDELAAPGSPYRLEFTMTAGQGLVFANSRLCHGRAAYTDDSAAPRTLLRGLFTTDLTTR
ncbi:TauD/TfdA family dioxygenase [Micromonospora sp. DT4]|uniref:TauD/TfdA family dioxygenase n=1 Tax=Micromonospora sp. DT4 TaxID=3393438 RepID=UPI003CF38CF4